MSPSGSQHGAPGGGAGKQPPKVKVKSSVRPNTLGLSQKDLVEVLERLEGRANEAPSVKRTFARWPFRHATVRVTLTQHSGAEVVLSLACRNLSRGGCSLLHNAFVHPGSQVLVSLPRPTGGAKDVAGVVRRCQHRRGVIHEVGVQFQHEVDVREFMGERAAADLYSLERIDPQQLEGTLLYVGASELDVKIIQHFLRDTRMAIKRCATGAEAAGEVSKSVSAVVCGWRLPDMTGAEFVARLRGARVHVPVVLLAEDAIEMYAMAGNRPPGTALVAPPLQQETLLRAIAEFLLIRDPLKDVGGRAADASEDGADPEICEHFQEMAHGLEACEKTGDESVLRERCAQVRSAALALGLTHIGQFAEAAVASIAQSDSSKRHEAVGALVQACRRLRSAA